MNTNFASLWIFVGSGKLFSPPTPATRHTFSYGLNYDSEIRNTIISISYNIMASPNDLIFTSIQEDVIQVCISLEAELERSEFIGLPSRRGPEIE